MQPRQCPPVAPRNGSMRMDLAALMRLADGLMTAVLVLLALGGTLLALQLGLLVQFGAALAVVAAAWLPLRWLHGRRRPGQK